MDAAAVTAAEIAPDVVPADALTALTDAAISVTYVECGVAGRAPSLATQPVWPMVAPVHVKVHVCDACTGEAADLCRCLCACLCSVDVLAVFLGCSWCVLGLHSYAGTAFEALTGQTITPTQYVPHGCRGLVCSALVASSCLTGGAVLLRRANGSPTNVGTTATLDAGHFYTLFVTDPDAPSRAEPTFREFVHAVVRCFAHFAAAWGRRRLMVRPGGLFAQQYQNIPGSATDLVAAGDVTLPYIGPGPPYNSGKHRYCFLLYDQGESKVDGSIAAAKFGGRGGCHIHPFAAEQGFTGPLAVGFFESEWEEFVDSVHEGIGFLPPPKYQSPAQAAAAAAAAAAGAGAGAGGAGAGSDGATQAALLLTETGHAFNGFKLGSIAVPTPGAGDVRIRIKAASVNPVDWKKAAYNFAAPGVPKCIVGCDGAGVVEAVGDGVTEYSVGDEVWGFHNLSLEGRGFFQESNIVRVADVYPKPSNLTFQQAATLGITGLTAGQALFDPALLGLNTPSAGVSSDDYVLVWGASSTVGQFAVQFAKNAGYKVIGTASARNHDLITSLGASVVVDYKDADVVDQVRAAVGDGKIIGALDCASAATALTCTQLVNADGGKVVCIAGTPSEGVPETVKVMGMFMGNQGTAECSAWLNAFVRKEFNPLLAAGKVVTPKILEVTGLEGVRDGLQMLAEHKVSATKVVATYA